MCICLSVCACLTYIVQLLWPDGKRAIDPVGKLHLTVYLFSLTIFFNVIIVVIIIVSIVVSIAASLS